MGFSNGVYSRSFNWQNDANASIPITALRFDTEDNGFATGLSTCLLKDGTQTVTANIPFANFRITGLGAATARTDAIQATQVQDSATTLCTVGGTANAITLTTTPSTTSYVTGRRLHFKATASSTNSVTINENALGALNLYLSGGATQAGNGHIVSGSYYTITYDGALNGNAGGYVMDSLSLGTASKENLGTVIVDDGSGNLTIGSGQTTNAMLHTVAALSIKGNNTTSTAAPSDLTGAQALSVLPIQSIQDFRLTLTSVTPVTTSDVTGATTIFCTPYKGSNIALYDGSANWNVFSSAEFSLALGTLTNALPYDVFCFNNSGTPTLEFLAWTNTTTRATALVKQNGILVKSGATTRRYMGTFLTTATTTTEDSLANRYLFNYNNRVQRAMLRQESTTTWTYTTNTFRQANGSTANQLNYVIGVAEDAVSAKVNGAVSNSSSSVSAAVAVGVDSTSAPSGINGYIGLPSNGIIMQGTAFYDGVPSGVGQHKLVWLESAANTGTATWSGNNPPIQTGISGTVWA